MTIRIFKRGAGPTGARPHGRIFTRARSVVGVLSLVSCVTARTTVPVANTGPAPIPSSGASATGLPALSTPGTNPAASTAETATLRSASTNLSAGQCDSVAPVAKIRCFQNLLSAKLNSEGLAAAMTLLDQLASSESVMRDNSHMFAHMLGLAAYTTPASSSRSFPNAARTSSPAAIME